MRDLRRASSETGGVSELFFRPAFIHLKVNSLFFIEEGVGTIITGHRSTFERRIAKGEISSLTAFCYPSQTADLNKIVLFVNTRPVWMHTGLFIIDSIPGGCHEYIV